MGILAVGHEGDDVDEAVEDQVVDAVAVFVLDQDGEERIADILQEFDDLLALDLHEGLQSVLETVEVVTPVEHVENLQVLREFGGAEEGGNLEAQSGMKRFEIDDFMDKNPAFP